jgi:hypothetical protein
VRSDSQSETGEGRSESERGSEWVVGLSILVSKKEKEGSGERRASKQTNKQTNKQTDKQST